MKRYYCIIVACAVLLSCSIGRQNPIEQLEKLTEDIRVNHKDYTVADWKQAYARYEQIVSEMEEYNYSSEEMKRVGELEGECVGYFMNSALHSFEGFKNEVKGFFDGLNRTIEQ